MKRKRSNLKRRLSMGVASVLLLVSMFLGITPPARAAPQPVTVTISSLRQLGDDFETTSLGDFYARVTINGTTQDTYDDQLEDLFGGYIIPTGNLMSDPWILTQDVPSELGTINVKLEVLDDDWPDPNDMADINPGSKEVVDLVVDLTTGKWSGDVNWPQSCTSGPLDLDSNSVEICFDINTISVSGDADEDGLLDNWEQKGIDFDLDGTIDLDLPAFGANPLRKDIFVEVDCVVAADHSHCPRMDSIGDVVQSFANAPVLNLDGTTGVQVHVDVGAIYGAGGFFNVPGAGGASGSYGDFGGGGNQINEVGNEIIESFSSPKGNGVPFATLKSTFFNEDRSPVFHYAIFGHQTNARQATGDCTSGEASDIPGHDFMVTLGGNYMNIATIPCWGVDANGFSVGSRDQQAGTFMHELGHVIGLQHGGDESIPNYKPNYLSVMNYAFQQCSVRSSPNGALPGKCDYSRVALPPLAVTHLDESSLDECLGIDANLFGFGPVNWDGDTLLEGITNCQPPNNTNVQMDINTDGIQTLLRGYDDWSNLNYRDGISGPGAGAGVPDEADPQTIQQAQEALSEMMAPGVIVTKTGPATALPGDVLNYSVEVSNEGKGPAFEAVLTDVNPDGASQETVIGSIIVGSESNYNSSFTVPEDACPGDFTSATATVTFEDFVGLPLSASGTAPLEILDITPPVVSLSVSPTTLWSPDHKLYVVTADLQVTDECDPNPEVTLVSITSNEPEFNFLGAGDKGPDIQSAFFGTDDRIFYLRAERGTGGSNTGRIYTITYEVSDASGNVTTVTETVKVPTSNRPAP